MEHQAGQQHEGAPAGYADGPMYGDSFGAARDQEGAHQQQGEEACHGGQSTVGGGADANAYNAHMYSGMSEGPAASVADPAGAGAEGVLHGATSQWVYGAGDSEEGRVEETEAELHARLEAEAEAEAEAYMRSQYGDNYAGADGGLCGGEGAGSDHGDVSDGNSEDGRRQMWQMPESTAVPQSPTTTRSADNTTATGSPDSRRWTPTSHRARVCEPPLMPSPDAGAASGPARKLRKAPLGAHEQNIHARDADLDERGAAF